MRQVSIFTPCKPRVLTIWPRKLTLFDRGSTRVTASSGHAALQTRAGKPAPVPISRRCTPVPSKQRQDGQGIEEMIFNNLFITRRFGDQVDLFTPFFQLVEINTTVGQSIRRNCQFPESSVLSPAAVLKSTIICSSRTATEAAWARQSFKFGQAHNMLSIGGKCRWRNN